MNVLNVMLKHFGYYILTMIVMSWFVTSSMQNFLLTLCGAAIFVSMFATIVQLFFDGSIGCGAQKVSAWCLRGTAIITGIAVISTIGINNIVKLFVGG